jgi:hypothetical protein
VLDVLLSARGFSSSLDVLHGDHGINIFIASFESLDPDPHRSRMLDLDPHSTNADSQHCVVDPDP